MKECYAGKKIEVSVEPTNSRKFYTIRYREKKKFNLFNAWKMLVYAWDHSSYDQPVMYENFEEAVAHAKRLQENPALIDEHYKREDERFRKMREEELRRSISRNKKFRA